MMNTKQETISRLRAEVNRWEALLAGLSEAQRTTPRAPSQLSIKDELVHLWAWQQRTIARMEAAAHGHAPRYPPWPAHLDPEAEDVDGLNAWIFETNRDRSWESVHRDWHDGFLHLIALAEAMPDEALLARYPWLEDYTPLFFLQASCDHHAEHYDQLAAWLRERGMPRNGEDEAR